MAQHVQIKIDSGTAVYFCDRTHPGSVAQRKHQRAAAPVLPRGTDLSRWTAEDLAAVATILNARPRKTLQWRTHAEALADYLTSLA